MTDQFDTPQWEPDVGAAWDPPTPFDTRSPEPLPLDACGPTLGPLAESISEALQAPADLAVNIGLSTIATAAQGRWRVRVSEDWTEILSISSTSVANSGERKSPILSILSTPLAWAERKLRDEVSAEASWREEQRTLAEERVKNARKAAIKDRSKEQYLRAAHDDLNQIEELHLPRLVADDATPEALVSLLDRQDGTIGVLSAEPGFFATLAGRYSNGVANLDGVLKATSGERIRVDRIGRDPIIIENPCLTVAVCIQPGLLEQLGKRPDLRYAGFLARFLYVYPAPMVGRRLVSTLPVRQVLKDRWCTQISSLALHAYSLKRSTESTELALDPESRRALDQFRTGLEPKLHPRTGDLASIADWGAKLPGNAVRIAAALTILEDSKADTIKPEVMADALRLVTAYVPHAVAVLDEIRGGGDGLGHARDVLHTIKHAGWQIFTQRDVHRRLEKTPWVKESRNSPQAVADELDTLAEYGHIREIQENREGPGRKPSQRYEVNPQHLPSRSVTP